jgi:hypothetical protein
LATGVQLKTLSGKKAFDDSRECPFCGSKRIRKLFKDEYEDYVEKHGTTVRWPRFCKMCRQTWEPSGSGKAYALAFLRGGGLLLLGVVLLAFVIPLGVTYELEEVEKGHRSLAQAGKFGWAAISALGIAAGCVLGGIALLARVLIRMRRGE